MCLGGKYILFEMFSKWDYLKWASCPSDCPPPFPLSSTIYFVIIIIFTHSVYQYRQTGLAQHLPASIGAKYLAFIKGFASFKPKLVWPLPGACYSKQTWPSCSERNIWFFENRILCYSTVLQATTAMGLQRGQKEKQQHIGQRCS